MTKGTCPLENVALFDMSEVVIGKKIDSGGFCSVYEVRAFHPSAVTNFELSSSQVQAREALSHNTNTRRHKEPQYAVKVLRSDLVRNPKKFRIASKDIETESLFLSILDHENIVKLRGCALGTGTFDERSQHGRCFIIMDRLDGTLDDRIIEWQHQMRRLKSGRLFGGARCGTKRGIKRHRLLVERLQVATEIASAIEYLHGKRMIYRDIKAGNVGITASGHAQLFDFGLCRFLPEESLAFEDSTYQMSGKVGTYRFMAPEIADARPYNELADTYSYVHLLYQILSLEKPYPTLSKQEHRKRVIDGGERPPIDSQWPRTIQELLCKGWSANISDRPAMSEVVAILKDVIADLDQDKSLSIVTAVSDLSTTGKTVKSGETLTSVTSFESQEPTKSDTTDAPPSPSLPVVISFLGW
jgi:serine/threonine protein kinase